MSTESHPFDETSVPFFNFDSDWESVYEEMVQPGRVVVVNDYFLRHLKQIGPELATHYVMMHQYAYTSGARNGQRTTRVSGRQIARKCHISDRAFWYRIENPATWEKLDGLVELIDETPKWDGGGATPKRQSHRYRIAMTLPLTADDASALRYWLLQHASRYPNIPELINAACATTIGDLLNEPGEATRPQTVHQLVRDLFGKNLPNDKLTILAEKLHLHIQPPKKLLVINLFFLEHVMHYLGVGPAWMLILLRDRCWTGPKNSSDRAQVTVQGGYAEIAAGLGLSRPKTVWEWLRLPIVQLYIRQHPSSPGGGLNQWDAPRIFDVLLDEIPAELMQACLRHINDSNGENFSIEPGDSAIFNGEDFSIGVAQFSASDGANFSMAVTQIAELCGASCRIIKSLSSFNLKHMAAPQKPPESKQPLGANAPVCAVEDSENQPPTTNTSSNTFPDDVQQSVQLFATLFGLEPPDRPVPGKRGGDFALWINGIRTLGAVAKKYGVTIENALQLTYEYWRSRPFTVSHPQALKKTLESVLARQRKFEPMSIPQAPTNTGAIYDPAQRRREISAALGFDISGPLTPDQQAALTNYLEQASNRLPPKNPFKP